MNCYVYKGDRKDDHYLYLPTEFDPASSNDELPQIVLKLMGGLSFVLEFELTQDRKLSQADAKHVIESIESKGFYLQMPKRDLNAEEDALFN